MSADPSHPAPDPAGAPPPEAALLDFLSQHKGLIQRVVRHVGGARAESVRDDVEQEVLVALWRRLSREQTLDLSPSYVYKAALRETVRALRRVAARRESPEDALLGLSDGTGEGPFQDLSHRECVEALEECLCAQPADRQRAARLHLQGFRVEEIMTLCDWPYQRARNLVARAMADLRQALRERGIDG